MNIIGRLLKNYPFKTATSENGNVVLMLFAGIAMVGVLGVTTTNFMQGPLRSAIKVTRQNTAETQMTVGAQVSVMAAATAANNGDCDNDGMIEPFEFLAAGTSPAPVGGGLVPMNIGISKKDPWGTDYGYCVWDFGTQALQPACQVTAGVNKRLQGSTNPAYPVVALISAGPDKTFTTTCRHFSTGATRADQNNNGVLTDAGDFPLVGKANPNDDDIIFAYTYQEAMAASGGLWTLKPNDPAKAVINKDLEVSGGATFSGTGMFARLAAAGSNFLEIISPLKLASPANAPTCSLANSGIVRLAADNKSIEICDGAAAPPAWIKVGSGGDTTTMMTVTATGSNWTKTAVGDFDIYEITGSTTLQVTALGNDPDFGNKIEYLIVGGGGGASEQAAAGAGGVVGGTLTATVQNYPVTIGAGGARTGGTASNGGSSSFAGFTALGGGGGGEVHNSPGRNGASGGGGNGGGLTSTPGGTGSPPQGYNGCAGYQSAVSNYYSGGGGGGAGGACPGGRQAGPGISSSITGSSVMYACGGEGRDLDSANISTTGRAGCAASVSVAPAANRGHGGGGSGTNAAKEGSAGVVILKIKQRGGTATSAIAYPLKAPDGSAAAPSYSFTSQPTKGMFIDSGNVKISGLAAPTANDQAANKAYVDTAVAAAGGGKLTYLGKTTTNYNGNLGGIPGANKKCETQFGSGARMMRYLDINSLTTDTIMANGWTWTQCTGLQYTNMSNYYMCDGLPLYSQNGAPFLNCANFTRGDGVGQCLLVSSNGSGFSYTTNDGTGNYGIHCVK